MGSKVPPMTPTRRGTGARVTSAVLAARSERDQAEEQREEDPDRDRADAPGQDLVDLVVGLFGGEHGGGEGAEHALSLPSAPDTQRTCPSPVTTYLVDVISGRPIGPRACSFWVLMPISAPNPNSPPSVNRVEALTSTAAESTSAVRRRAAAR